MFKEIIIDYSYEKNNLDFHLNKINNIYVDLEVFILFMCLPDSAICYLVY